MNAIEIEQMVGAICQDLDLDGRYAQIMPLVTAQQLGNLLDVAEQGGNAEMWSHLAAQFLQYGNEAVIAAGIDRLVSLIEGSGRAAWVLLEARSLTKDHRAALVALVTDSRDAAWVLKAAPHLTDEHRKRLVPLVTDSRDAAWLLLREAPHLSNEQRDLLVKRVTGSKDATWVLRNAPNLSDKHRAHLAKIAS